MGATHVATNQLTGGTSLALTMPAAALSGDLVLLWVYHKATTTPATPANYTLLASVASTSGRSTVFGRILTAGAASGSAIATITTTSSACGAVSIWRGAGMALPSATTRSHTATSAAAGSYSALPQTTDLTVEAYGAVIVWAGLSDDGLPLSGVPYKYPGDGTLSPSSVMNRRTTDALETTVGTDCGAALLDFQPLSAATNAGFDFQMNLTSGLAPEWAIVFLSLPVDPPLNLSRSLTESVGGSDAVTIAQSQAIFAKPNGMTAVTNLDTRIAKMQEYEVPDGHAIRGPERGIRTDSGGNAGDQVANPIYPSDARIQFENVSAGYRLVRGATNLTFIGRIRNRTRLRGVHWDIFSVISGGTQDLTARTAPDGGAYTVDSGTWSVLLSSGFVYPTSLSPATNPMDALGLAFWRRNLGYADMDLRMMLRAEGANPPSSGTHDQLTIINFDPATGSCYAVRSLVNWSTNTAGQELRRYTSRTAYTTLATWTDVYTNHFGKEIYLEHDGAGNVKTYLMDAVNNSRVRVLKASYTDASPLTGTWYGHAILPVNNTNFGVSQYAVQRF